jgi:hypothetical protein
MKMKRNNLWKTGICIALALVMLLGGALSAAAEEAAFSIRNGIGWDSTLEDVKAAEGLTDETTYEEAISEGGGYLTCTVGEGEDAVSLTYMFFNSQLTMVMAQYMKTDLTEGFNAEKAAIVALYGEPTETEPVTSLALLGMINESLLDDATLADYAGWVLDDVTQVYLLNADGQLGALYFNVERFMAMMTAMMGGTDTDESTTGD